jgi:hypothetical protein
MMRVIITVGWLVAITLAAGFAVVVAEHILQSWAVIP